jgi:Cof subfamily protein (haloacid dehalogenase superfamily)
MAIKLIGIDFDGTLLNDKKQIPPLNVEMIKRATDEGVMIVLTTGRPINEVTQGYHHQLGIFKKGHPFIAYNGAAVMDITDGTFFIKNELNLTEVKEVFAHAEKYNAVCYAYRNDALLYNFLNDYIWEEKIFNDTVFKPIDLDSLPEDFTCFKVMFAESPELLDRMEQEMPQSLRDKYTILRSLDHFLEFIPKCADKWTALKSVGEMYGIKEDEIMAIGDSMNDYSFKNAKYSVAMVNAVPGIKSAFRYQTTLNNNEGGVGQIICDMVLEDKEI